jgi:hypothetical protein
VKNVKELGLAVPLTLQTRADEVIEWNDGRPLRCFAIRPGRHLPARPSTACLSLLHFELLDKCSEMRRNGRRQSVVPVLQESPNYYEGRAPIASGVAAATWPMQAYISPSTSAKRKQNASALIIKCMISPHQPDQRHRR